jgi:hypothetical protein
VRALARRWLEETHGDADLGRASLGTLAARMMGETNPARIREMEQMFSMLERSGMLRAIMGGLGGGGQGGGLGALLGGGGQQGGGAGGLGGILNGGAGSGGGSDAMMQGILRALGGGGGGATSGRPGPGLSPGGTGGAGAGELQELLRQFMGD